MSRLLNESPLEWLRRSNPRISPRLGLPEAPEREWRVSHWKNYLVKGARHTSPKWELNLSLRWKSNSGSDPKKCESLEQALVHPKMHEWGELAEDTLDLSMICPLKKISPISHPLGTKVMEMKSHQRTGATTWKGHEHKKIGEWENREILVKKWEKRTQGSCWFEKGLSPLYGQASRNMMLCEARWEFRNLEIPTRSCFALSVRLQRPVLDQSKIGLWWITQGKDDSSLTVGNFCL